MKLYVITPEEQIENEPFIIECLLKAGVTRVHIRHPQLQSDYIRRLLDSITPEYLPQLSLHDCHELAQDYGTGIHLNGRHRYVPPEFSGVLSKSCHSISEEGCDRLDYYFLSPVFSSISKQGYHPTLTHEVIREAFRSGMLDERAVALGGVTPERMTVLRDMGFSSAAMLGYIWEGTTEEIIRRITTLCSNL